MTSYTPRTNHTQSRISVIENDIPVHVLKLAFPVIGRHLLRINYSIVSETVPGDWKSAIVIPLHKKGDAAQAANYRPITNVPIMCKIIEKIIYNQLASYMERNHLYSEDQHGFRSGHSTTTALLTVTDNILNGMDRGEVSLMTLLDLSRCFDVIDHKMLLEKLRQLKVSTGCLESYLQGHVQRVRVNGTTSEPRDITIGTFQGSSLGPLLFNIMANDLSTYIPATIDSFRVTVARYADNTQIVLTGPKNRLTDMQSSMSSVLDDMLTWFLQHGMKVNTKKTELLLIGVPRTLPRPEDATPISVQFNGETVRESEKGSVRNLGVTIDKNLNLIKHIESTVAKCCGILTGLASAKHVLPSCVLPQIIDSLVFSHLRYCVQAYGNASNCHLQQIQKVFNFAARVISGRRKFEHVSDVTRALGWLSARDFIDLNDICLLHRIITQEQPTSIASHIKRNHQVVSRATRQSDLLAVPRARTKHGQRTFHCLAAKLYNTSVIAKRRQSLSMRRLKAALKRDFISRR